MNMAKLKHRNAYLNTKTSGVSIFSVICIISYINFNQMHYCEFDKQFNWQPGLRTKKLKLEISAPISWKWSHSIRMTNFKDEHLTRICCVASKTSSQRKWLEVVKTLLVHVLTKTRSMLKSVKYGSWVITRACTAAFHGKVPAGSDIWILPLDVHLKWAHTRWEERLKSIRL